VGGGGVAGPGGGGNGGPAGGGGGGGEEGVGVGGVASCLEGDLAPLLRVETPSAARGGGDRGLQVRRGEVERVVRHAGGVAGRERERALALVRYEVRRHGVGDLGRDVRFEPSAPFPVLHLRAIAEFLGQVVHAVLPFGEFLRAEPAARFDICYFGFPVFHAGSHFAAVHEAEMLPEMVFAIERSRFKTFLFAGGVVVCFEMLSGGIQSIAVNAFALARG